MSKKPLKRGPKASAQNEPLADGGSFRAPDPKAFAYPDPFNSREILVYYDKLRLAHGYIRFVSLPHLDDRPDVQIDRLYVPCQLATRHIQPNEDPKDWGQVEGLLEAIEQNPRLVILGDPGSGKSTLVSWATWQLSSARASVFCRRLGPLVPLPFVLRDLRIDRHITWDKLLELFVQQEFQRIAEVGKGQLSRQELENLLGTGQAFILLDGLDEISAIPVREALREAVRAGMARHPNCRFLITSRIVGYADASFSVGPRARSYYKPFEQLTEKFTEDLTGKFSQLPTVESANLVKATFEMAQINSKALEFLKSYYRGLASSAVALRFAAPFGNPQIELFAKAWYHRFASESGATGVARASDLVSAINAHPATLALARVPILLTFIALIHRIEAKLPQGRVRLYSKIADAYLESIDAYRRLQDPSGSRYTLEEKRRWLAFVAFQLQRRRASKSTEPPGSEAQEILAEEKDLVGWLAQAMSRSPTAASGEQAQRAEARSFLDYLARRSGLLLPRGEGLYAFAHLSIQEYFAAEHLRLVRRSRQWLKTPKTENGDGPEDLRNYTDQETWSEVLFLLFGLYAGDPEGASELAEDLFGKDFSRIEIPTHSARKKSSRDNQKSNRVALFAMVSVDRHGGLDASTRRKIWLRCWRWELAAATRNDWAFGWQPPQPIRRVPSILLSADEGDLSDVITALAKGLDNSSSADLSLAGTAISSLEWVASVPRLEAIDLKDSKVSDLGPLSCLSKLSRLDLSGTKVVDLEPLRERTHLQYLDLRNTQVSDIGPLSGLSGLRHLDISGTKVSVLEPLRDLFGLRRLLLADRVTNLEPLRELTALDFLAALNSKITDLEPLRNLTSLRSLFLVGNDFAALDLEPLSGLKKLQHLSVLGSGATDIEALRGLTSLEFLDLSGSQVSDLAPLRGLGKLGRLYVANSEVFDLGPLQELGELRSLDITDTLVTDLEPLRGLPNLKIVEGISDEQRRSLGIPAVEVGRSPAGG